MNMAAQMLDRKERPPIVRFERTAVEDHEESRKQGRYVAKNVDVAKITPAYSRDVFITPVDDWFAQLRLDVANERIPAEWVEHFRLMYQKFQNGEELPLNGTPIRGWLAISPALQETLVRMNILTIEDAAGMNDEAIRRGGMGMVEVKNKAIAALKAANDTGGLVAENADLRARLQVAEKNVDSLAQAVSDLKSAIELKSGVVVPQRVEIAASDLIEDEPTRAQLEAQYRAKFGKPVHPATKDETLRARLAE